tara:strand:- start:139 stop:453 length:315 start_codon:yes stop_codon:yes gene_type:complete
MNIYNITFIVEPEIEKDWVEFVDREVLPELGKNVHQVDLLKVKFEEGMDNVKGSTFSVQFYCKDKDMISWVRDIGHQMLLQKLNRKFSKNWLAFASTLEFIKSY